MESIDRRKFMKLCGIAAFAPSALLKKESYQDTTTCPSVTSISSSASVSDLSSHEPVAIQYNNIDDGNWHWVTIHFNKDDGSYFMATTEDGLIQCYINASVYIDEEDANCRIIENVTEYTWPIDITTFEDDHKIYQFGLKCSLKEKGGLK